MDTHLCAKTEQDSVPDGAGPVPDLSGVHLVSQLEGMVTVFCRDAEATEALGFFLGTLAGGGDVFCLNGALGAGKTLLTKGLASAVGVPESDVVSPSFSLLNVYEGKTL